MKKYYAVKKGRETGIFTDWTSCEKQIKGFSGAEYKSFASLEEANNYLLAFQKKSLGDKSLAEFPCAYIDGSYDVVSCQFSYGVVIRENADNEHHFTKCFEHSELASMRNVAGEIKASEFAIQYAVDHSWPKLTIYYDYFGIEKWATGEWKRNLPATKRYYTFCQEAFTIVDVTFIKVKSHSGDKYNDLADSLAKQALNNTMNGVKE